MAVGVNKCLFIGNVTKDIEVKYSQGGTAVANFTLAVNERQKKGDKWEDHVEWVPVVVFGKTAENCAQYLKKGSSAFIEGRIQNRKWQDKEGKDRYTTEIVAATVQFLGGKSGGQSEDPNSDIPF